MASDSILIVDDWPDIRTLVGSFLKRFGYEILEAKNGAQAIQTAVTADPKLILLDLRLPDMDGVEVGRALRKFPGTEQIPIVGWTVDPASKPRTETLRDAGFVDCLEKPISLGVLEALIERFVPKPSH